MTSEEAIEEAAKAIWETRLVVVDDDLWERLDGSKSDYVREARAAFAVFEKANAPTGDEREALACILDGNQVPPSFPNAQEFWADEVDAILAAGFRRTVQGEPSGIPFYGEKMRELDEARAQSEPTDEREARRDLAERARMAANDLWNRGMDVITRWSHGETFTTRDIKTLADAYEAGPFRHTMQGEPSKPKCGGGSTNCRHDQYPPMHTMACPVAKARATSVAGGGERG